MKTQPLTALVITLLTATLAACSTSHDSLEARSQLEQMVSKIDTTTDPAFVYGYEKSKFVPPAGTTLLMMGQSVEAIDEYLEAFADRPIPGGWAAYWGIPEFKGVTEAHTNVVGSTNDHQMLVDTFPNTAVHSALWMVGTWDIAKNAGSGEYDGVIKQYSNWAKTIDRPIFLRIGYEFDGPHNALEPAEYVKAYRRIVDLMRSEGADNIAFVWHSYAAPRYRNYPLTDWYPGDDYVDWFALSIFAHAYNSPDMGPQAAEMLALARDKKKPVMIAETNPISGIAEEGTEAWDSWFVNLFTFVYEKNIKAISFISEDWNRLSIEGLDGWGDARLMNNPVIADAWFAETNKDRYLKQSPQLFRLLGYNPDE